MDRPSPPPLPERPDFETKPRGTWLAILLVAFGALAITVIMTFLTLGFFGPFVLLSLGVFAIIGLQYLIWGWLFERIYRTDPPDSGEILPVERPAGEREA